MKNGKIGKPKTLRFLFGPKSLIRLTDDGFTFLIAGFRKDIVEEEDNHTMFDPIRMFCRERTFQKKLLDS